MRNRTTLIAGFVAAMALVACSDGTPRLMNLTNSESGPDEFGVVPPRPLEMPASAALPTPTPGGSNRAEPTPEADAIAALGGDISRGSTGSQGLLAYANRYGVEANIRGVLAAEDEAFRRDNDGRVLERLFNVNVYFEAYSAQALDRYAEFERLRRSGVRTPSAPPQ